MAKRIDNKTLTKAKVRRVWLGSKIQYKEVPTPIAKKETETILA